MCVVCALSCYTLQICSSGSPVVHTVPWSLSCLLWCAGLPGLEKVVIMPFVGSGEVDLTDVPNR